MNTSVTQGFWALLLARLEEVQGLAIGGAIATILFTLSTPYLKRRFSHRWPADPAKQRSWLTDITWALMSPVAEIFGRSVVIGAVAVCALLMGRDVEPKLLQGFGPVTHQPYWLIVLEVLFLSDFIFYWTHRLAHRWPLLWRLHAVHHSTEHMHAPAALRVHPLESYALILNTLPLFALGFPLDALAAVGPISFLYALFIHSDLSFGVRRFVWVINSPAYHRWHHSREYIGDGSNFAGYFPIFDVLFGSYHFPKEPPKALGIDDENMPKTYAAQMAYPLRRTAPSAQHAITLGEKHAELQ